MPGPSLGHVRWVGGASGAGKSTITWRLANTFGLQVFDTDELIPVHGAEPGPDAPLLARFSRMSMDERWLARDPGTMRDTFPWFAGERFDLIVRDLHAAAGPRPVLAEGFRLRPGLVRPVLEEPWQAVWLVPTTTFRRSAFARRAADQQFWLRTSDPTSALERLLDRDALFGEQVMSETQQLGLKAIVIDGTRTEADVADEVACWFRLQASTDNVPRQ